MSAKLLVDKIKNGRIWKFFGGIRPRENKSNASLAIERTAIPTIITLPVDRHVGAEGKIIVNVGDYVKKGQPLTIAGGKRLVPLHASTSGTITSIVPEVLPHPSGFCGTCISIKPDGLDCEYERSPWPDYQNHSSDELLERIRQYGIEGLGGAQFQTASKLRSGRDDCEGGCKLFIINGCECEPTICSDDRLMQERALEIVAGIKVIQHILKPKLTIIAIENNKPQAIANMQKAAAGIAEVRALPVVYPSGAARNLIKILTGLEIPYDEHTSDCGIVVNNVGTVLACKEAVIDGKPLTERVVTVAGESLKSPKNLYVRLGTSVRFLLNTCKLMPEQHQRIILGGPMMGFTVKNIDVPVTKSLGCIIAPSHQEIPFHEETLNCLRCGRCARVCPSRLVPYQMYQQSKAGNHAAAQKCGISDCTECGCCSYVCPSHIDLTAQFRYEKAVEKHLADVEKRNQRARERMALHDERVEKERLAREAKKAAALARIKASQNAQGGANASAEQSAQMAAIAASRKAAIERRQALKAQMLKEQALISKEKALQDHEQNQISDADRSPDVTAITALKEKTSAVEIINSADTLFVPKSLLKGDKAVISQIVKPFAAPAESTSQLKIVGRLKNSENGVLNLTPKAPASKALPEALKKKTLRNNH